MVIAILRTIVQSYSPFVRVIAIIAPTMGDRRSTQATK
jgi:hypothetical protein